MSMKRPAHWRFIIGLAIAPVVVLAEVLWVTVTTAWDDGIRRIPREVLRSVANSWDSVRVLTVLQFTGRDIRKERHRKWLDEIRGSYGLPVTRETPKP